MAHFAEIKNDIVQRVVVINNNELLVDGVELESKGAEFCQNLFGGTWVQTSYNNKFRGIYAGTGYTYDAVNDVFVAPSSLQPQPSAST